MARSSFKNDGGQQRTHQKLAKRRLQKPQSSARHLVSVFHLPCKKTISICLFWFIKVYKLPGRFHLFSSSTSWSTSLAISIITFNCLGFVDHSFKKTSQEMQMLSSVTINCQVKIAFDRTTGRSVNL